MWNQGEQATQQAVAEYNRAVDQANQQAGNGQPVAQIGPFSDPGAGQRDAAQRLLGQARDGLTTAGNDAATTVGQACQKAPQKPGFWAKVGDFLGDAASAVGGAVKETVLTVGDAVASYGNAMIHHPEDVAMLIGGTMLAGVSAVGDGVGGLLDATGVGAVAGVPINVVSTAGVVAGAGIMAMAATDLGHHAATDDAVHTEREPEPTPEERPTTKTDRLKEHVSERDLDAARRELDGEVVARKPNGTPWDHVTEVREAQRGLVNRIGQINRALGDPRLGAAERAALQDELSQASRLLDHSEGFVPR